MLPRLCFAVLVGLSFVVPPAAAQQAGRNPDSGLPDSPSQQDNSQLKHERLERLPIEWIIGPYIPIQEPLHPLSNRQRAQIYLRQTFVTAGSYMARAFSAGLDQARGEPHEWGGGVSGYGRRYVARYGQFVIQNSIFSAGNALLGYEPRYDFCRCDGFWRRTGHAVSRNFLAYNKTERELRPQLPMYAAAFTAGVLYNTWLPERQRIWRGGVYSMVSQAAIGSGYNFVSEFSLDILHAFGLKKNVRRKTLSIQ